MPFPCHGFKAVRRRLLPGLLVYCLAHERIGIMREQLACLVPALPRLG